MRSFDQNPTNTDPQDMSNEVCGMFKVLVNLWIVSNLNVYYLLFSLQVDSGNRSSTINIPNFLALMPHKMKVKGVNSKEAVKGDMDSDGFILVAKLRNVMANLG